MKHIAALLLFVLASTAAVQAAPMTDLNSHSTSQKSKKSETNGPAKWNYGSLLGFLNSNHTSTWRFTYAGISYAVNLASIQLKHVKTTIVATGTGLAYLSGDPNAGTSGSWKLSFGLFTPIDFDFYPSNVPDGGSTAILIGMGLLGLGLAGRRRLLRS